MLLQLLIIGVVIGSNNFATSLALGALGQEDKHRRILIMFGVFEFSILGVLGHPNFDGLTWRLRPIQVRT